MALGSLLALLDDIAVILDDVSVMTKVAAKKTAGVLGDDLAVNAEKVLGCGPIVNCRWYGPLPRSFLNKCIFSASRIARSRFCAGAHYAAIGLRWPVSVF